MGLINPNDLGLPSLADYKAAGFSEQTDWTDETDEVVRRYLLTQGVDLRANARRFVATLKGAVT